MEKKKGKKGALPQFTKLPSLDIVQEEDNGIKRVVATLRVGYHK